MQLSAAELTGTEIVSLCEYKNPGLDQRSRLTITLTERDGHLRKNVYRRLWKSADGKKELIEKMVLFTESPADAKGTGFLRWGYSAESGKVADQWLYLPSLRKIRRVSVRDPGDSFLGSDLTFGDIEARAIGADSHLLLRIDSDNMGEYYVVESVPQVAAPQYSRRISWYKKSLDRDACVRSRTEYYDRQGALLKVQVLSWQNIEGAWAWDRVTVENLQTHHSSVFEITDLEVGVGLKERLFTERALKRGYSN